MSARPVDNGMEARVVLNLVCHPCTGTQTTSSLHEQGIDPAGLDDQGPARYGTGADPRTVFLLHKHPAVGERYGLVMLHNHTQLAVVHHSSDPFARRSQHSASWVVIRSLRWLASPVQVRLGGITHKVRPLDNVLIIEQAKAQP